MILPALSIIALSMHWVINILYDTGRSIEYRYEKDRLAEVVHMDGGVERFFYDSADNCIWYVLPGRAMPMT